MFNQLKNLNKEQEADFWRIYLAFLAKSIDIDQVSTPEEVPYAEGWGDNKSGYSWESRCAFWYRNEDTIGYLINQSSWVEHPNKLKSTNNVIPIFPNYAKRALGKVSKNKQEDSIASYTQPQVLERNTMKTSISNTLSAMKEKNLIAAEITAKITLGKTANSFFLTKILGKFPWYVKMFSRKQDAQNNPIAKLVTAQTALALATQFAPENKKLNYVADAMVTEAMVDLTVNSAILEKMISELEDMVTLPDSLKDAK